jgi:hypothetical protein
MTYTYIYRHHETNYIGKTKNIQKRELIHNSVLNNENSNRYNLKLYEKCRELGITYIKLIIIKRTKMTIPKKLEQWYINKFDSINNGGNTINSYITPEQKQEYHQKHKQKINETSRQYNQKHKERLQKKKQQYHIENKQKINERSRQWHNDNKTKLNEKFDCNCGGNYTYHHKARHMKSQKHTDYLNKNIN